MRQSLTQLGMSGDGPSSDFPAYSRSAAIRAFAARDTRSDLAVTVFNSQDEDDPGSGHEVRFAAGSLHITLSSSGCAETGLLVKVDPAPADLAILTLEVQRGEEPVGTRPGSQEWHFLPTPSGPISVLLIDGARRVRTEWTRW